MNGPMPALPTYDDVAAAAARIAPAAHRTPVLSSRTADEETGAALFFKCENFQRMVSIPLWLSVLGLVS